MKDLWINHLTLVLDRTKIAAMSPLEARRVLIGIGISLEGWSPCPAGGILYEAKEDKFARTRGPWNIGKHGLSSVTVGEDGDSLEFDTEVVDAPIGVIEGSRYRAITHHEYAVFGKDSIRDIKEPIPTNNPFIKRQVRHVSR